MFRKNQLGYATVPILMVLVLVGGVGLGVYLVGQRTNLFPQAAQKVGHHTNKNNAPNETHTNFYMSAWISSEAQSPSLPSASNGGILLGTTGPESSLVKANAVKVGQKIYLPIRVASEKEAANLFVASLKFSNELLQVEQIVIDNSTGLTSEKFVPTLWVENKFKNELGTISLIGGKPNPGYKSASGQKGLMAVVIFSAKKNGMASVTFEEETTMYSNADNRAMSKTTGTLAFNIGGPTGSPSASASPAAKIKGDANGDGKVDNSDVSILVSLLNQSANDHKELDFNNDGKINSVDMGSLLRLSNTPK